LINENEVDLKFAIILKYGSILKFAKERKTTHTSINKYIDIFIGKRPEPKWERRDAAYHYSDFKREIKKLLKKKEKVIKNIAKKSGVDEETVNRIIAFYFEELEKEKI